MAKKKEDKKEEIFNINDCYEKINPFIVEGLKRYIILNNIEIKNEQEFDKIYKKYNGE